MNINQFMGGKGFEPVVMKRRIEGVLPHALGNGFNGGEIADASPKLLVQGKGYKCSRLSL